MKILVLGAGAVGGYFGGRLAQVGADVAFLVRDRRADQLEREGLVVKSPHGDFTQPVQVVRAGQARPEYEVVMISCKAYDLESAIDSIRPAVGPQTLVLPLLNGLAHLDRLDAEFGASHVLGGTCHLAGTLTPEGHVAQLSLLHRIAFGRRPANDARATAALLKLAAAYNKTSVDSQLASDIMLEMWEKFVLLATLAGMTCLMRGAVGDIMAAEDGEVLMLSFLAACEATAGAAGYAPRPERTAQARKLLTERGSTFTASMLRDLESGRPTEHEHIVGDMLRRATRAGAATELLRAAYCHLQAHAARRARSA